MVTAQTTTRMTTAELLQRLVAFDSTSRNANMKLIDFVRGYLDGLGIEYRVSSNPTGEKANLHAIVGPRQPGGLALSGHVDTVPVDGQAWSGDPFVLRQRDGKLFARGSCDMKGFVSACFAAVPGMALPADHALATVVKQVVGSDSPGKISYGTEGGFFETAGIPTIICGPGHIAQAHQPDEWIAESELEACDRFIRQLSDHLLI
jgi:acetylornithine deacetylase/succinyl-diaminopimelate desuccinylase-like protein